MEELNNNQINEVGLKRKTLFFLLKKPQTNGEERKIELTSKTNQFMKFNDSNQSEVFQEKL